MKKFEMPQIRVEQFDVEDIVTASAPNLILPDDEGI